MIESYNHHPSDFIHGLLSSHSYQNSKSGDKVEFPNNNPNTKYNQYLTNWQVNQVFDCPEFGKYYAVLYVNRQDHQLVLAHRGTVFEILDMFKSISPVSTDIKGILEGHIDRPQQSAAYKSCGKTVEYAKEQGYHLSFTGHSLGAWLAELALYHCCKDYNYMEAKAVTFDSPGSYKSFKQLKSNVKTPDNKFKEADLPIVSYLSAPNVVNSCNEHVGQEIYRIYPKIPTSNSIAAWLMQQALPTWALYGLFSISGHSLDLILETFSSETGKPVQYDRVKDWPVIKYESGIQSDSVNIIKVIKLFTNLVNGNLNLQQYWQYFEYLDTRNDKYIPREDLPVEQEFVIKYEAHYRVEPIKPYEDIYNRKKSSDFYLKRLQETGNLGDGKVAQELEELKSQYRIEEKSDRRKYIITNNAITVDDLRKHMSSLINQPKVKELIGSKVYTRDTGKVELSSELAFEKKKDFIKVKDQNGQYFIDQVAEQLQENQALVVRTFPGVGKSALASQYGHQQKVIVRWIDAGSAEKITAFYQSLLVTLGVHKQLQGRIELITEQRKCNALGASLPPIEKEAAIQLINHQFSQIKSPILLIFDDVTDYQHVRYYILNLPQHVKVLITTRLNYLDHSLDHMTLLPFSKDEAREFLTNTLHIKGITQDSVESLVKEYATHGGLLPLKLQLAAVTINKDSRLTVKKYLQDIKKYEPEDQETNMLFKQLNKQEIAWSLLHYATYLDHDFIGLRIFDAIFGQQLVDQAIKELSHLSLVEVVSSNEEGGVRIHPLIYDSAKKYIVSYPAGKLEPKVVIGKLINVLNQLFPEEVTEMSDENWQEASNLYKHFCVIQEYFPVIQADLTDQEKEDILSLSKKLNNLGVGCYNKWQFNQAIEYYTQSLEMKKLIYKDKPHPDVADSFNNLGIVYDRTGEYNKAIEYSTRSLEIMKIYKYEPHPSVADFLMGLDESNNLSTTSTNTISSDNIDDVVPPLGTNNSTEEY
ncbi:MAG: tetratricopeptide repeat protein [Rickettsia endosymbiont of Pseudomimeciton antennatum]|nr:tetratricopeptide repeat protein [Rickettsia endosymbiont of Pseudomimeciton antennatum]